jgi:hypothetical protein
VSTTDIGGGLARQGAAGGPPRDPQAQYAEVRDRIHALAGCLIDRDSTVAVVSKGDGELVRLGSNDGWHFPRTEDGKYAGHHPADGSEAIAHLEQLRRQGAHYFLLPSTYFWWLDHYQGLAKHLQSRYRLVADCPDTCLIYDLRRGVGSTRPHVAAPRAHPEGGSNGERVQDPLVPAIRAVVDSLLPDGEPVLVVSGGNEELLRLGRAALHFPVDGRGGPGSTGSIGQGTTAAQLTDLRARGVRYVVVPDTAREGVERPGALPEPVRERGREVAFREGICTIYELEHAERTRTGRAARRLRRLLRPSRGKSDD